MHSFKHTASAVGMQLCIATLEKHAYVCMQLRSRSRAEPRAAPTPEMQYYTVHCTAVLFEYMYMYERDNMVSMVGIPLG